MTASERRSAIAKRLQGEHAPLSAAALAAQFHVSRQIIVGDVALLRATGHKINATPRGYVLSAEPEGQLSLLACIHRPEDMGRELNLIVDNGGEVLDVVVEHPVYGQLAGQLQLRSRRDVAEFLKKAEGAQPLSNLTGGVHLHTVRCPDEETLSLITRALRAEGFLLEE